MQITRTLRPISTPRGVCLHLFLSPIFGFLLHRYRLPTASSIPHSPFPFFLPPERIPARARRRKKKPPKEPFLQKVAEQSTVLPSPHLCPSAVRLSPSTTARRLSRRAYTYLYLPAHATTCPRLAYPRVRLPCWRSLGGGGGALDTYGTSCPVSVGYVCVCVCVP
ncbi:hypothetical protein GGS23DRAFT_167676 [Durotheca rogersii]|uniref:uncharacterized protein n=1 Tax=Durotheca rogersii TaxID=419775 RepID=UPI00221FFCFB|nr:uncharacterized protein GGS23DRAFT_167676 [Durotheca rogersii]KAI5867247.1 hypothetical protein GGS23DRAFT_167676 [Durotheca rogersii]